MTSTVDELLQAEAKLWYHAFSYIKSMALQSAIKLGIPNAIHRLGGVASLSELHAAVPVAASKRQCLSRLLRFLAASGILDVVETPPADDDGGGGTDTAGPYYRQTTASCLLVDEEDAGAGRGHRRCLSPLVVMVSSPFYFAASQSLAEWLTKEEDGAAAAAAVPAPGDGETPFTVAHGKGLYGFLGRHRDTSSSSSFGACFGKAMESDGSFLVDIIVRECTKSQVLAGVTSLVDGGRGNGTAASAIAKAFPHVRCSVLELPYVVDAAPADSAVEFVAGDMMEFIPPADAVFFKGVLHNWSDEECIRILKRANDAICAREPKGKVIIVDVVIGYPSKQASEAQLLFDLCMMVVTTGKQREEETWHKIFLAAGFTRYKIVPALGSRSLIEVYPKNQHADYGYMHDLSKSEASCPVEPLNRSTQTLF